MMVFGGAGRPRRSSSSGGGQGQAIVFILALALMILAPIFAYLIYFAISRKREYLADASGALYTRYPEGLASALEKLGASTGQLKTANQAMAPMYIVNPFRQKGREAADLTSTHPPISERIRILRSMAGGVSFAGYDQAYRQVHRGGGGIIPASALALAGASYRAVTPEEAQQEPDRLARTRETSDLMWRMSNYKTINCDCGTKLRVPPGFRESEIRCPHCGRINPV
jgi:heat shock protein HtpX